MLKGIGALFSILCSEKHVAGLAADVGTLQRMPKIIGSESLMRELAYTARFMGADEARQCGLVSRTFPDKDRLGYFSSLSPLMSHHYKFQHIINLFYAAFPLDKQHDAGSVCLG